MRVTRFPGAGAVRVVIAHENITERKMVEARVERSNRLYQALGETNDAIIRIRDRTALLREVAAITARLGHFLACRCGCAKPAPRSSTRSSPRDRTGDDLDDVIRRSDSGSESGGVTAVSLSEDPDERMQ
jgi:hypothetical protein